MTAPTTSHKDAASNGAPVDLDMLRTRLEVSVGMTRTLVASWLPPEDDDDKETTTTTTTITTQSIKSNNNSKSNKQEQITIGGMTARPPRLGLGAKYLPHRQAIQSINTSNGKGMLSEDKLRRKLTGNQRSTNTTNNGSTNNITTITNVSCPVIVMICSTFI
ncbi:hypothetical protein BDF22DRAFT_30657 [Syncephalis plumigaleata]|nr:hypothetical protein BDF22DRAFT_30657 [Syncephalis plumigaleata]